MTQCWGHGPMSIIYLRANARNWTRRPNARAEKASAIAIAIAMAMATATVVDSSNGDGGSNNDNTNGDRAPLYEWNDKTRKARSTVYVWAKTGTIEGWKTELAAHAHTKYNQNQAFGYEWMLLTQSARK
ncbi:hypothetical protein F5X97DRAFT_323222 [Nemania serpens]|nr:hypothetical protein F5X97DRAFT_323222 [Nemania serpens]